MLWNPTPRNVVVRMKLYRHDPLLDAVNAIVVAAEPTETVEGDSEKVQAVCITVTGWLAIAIDPFRDWPVLFCSILRLTVPLPCPKPDVRVPDPFSHEAPETVFHAQDPVMFTLTMTGARQSVLANRQPA